MPRPNEADSELADVYAANRSLFEDLLRTAIQKASEGDDVSGDVDILLRSYNSASLSAQTLMADRNKA